MSHHIQRFLQLCASYRCDKHSFAEKLINAFAVLSMFIILINHCESVTLGGSVLNLQRLTDSDVEVYNTVRHNTFSGFSPRFIM